MDGIRAKVARQKGFNCSGDAANQSEGRAIARQGIGPDH
jgi:hypothetical protein